MRVVPFSEQTEDFEGARVEFDGGIGEAARQQRRQRVKQVRHGKQRRGVGESENHQVVRSGQPPRRVNSLYTANNQDGAEMRLPPESGHTFTVQYTG
jgi:hypothetical protein